MRLEAHLKSFIRLLDFSACFMQCLERKNKTFFHKISFQMCAILPNFFPHSLFYSAMERQIFDVNIGVWKFIHEIYNNDIWKTGFRKK